MQICTTQRTNANPASYYSVSGYNTINNAGAPTIAQSACTLLGHSGTISSFTVECQANSSPNDCIWTIYRNAVATAIQVTIAPGGTYGIDSVNAVHFTATDHISIFYDNANGDPTPRHATALTFTLDP